MGTQQTYVQGDNQPSGQMMPYLDSNNEIDTDNFMGRSKAFLEDDFMTYVDAQMWTKGGTGNTTTLIAGGVGGQISVASGATSGNTGYERSTGAIIVGNQAGQRLLMRVKCAETTAFKFQCGITTSATAVCDGATTYGNWVEYNSALTAPTHWYTNYNNNGTPGTAADTGIVNTTSAYHLIEFYWPSATQINIYIDGVLAATQTNVYAQNNYIFAIITTSTTASKTFYLDTVSYWALRA